MKNLQRLKNYFNVQEEIELLDKIQEQIDEYDYRLLCWHDPQTRVENMLGSLYWQQQLNGVKQLLEEK